MSCHHPESRCRCGYAVVAVAFVLSALASAFGTAAYRNLSDRLDALEHRPAAKPVDLSAVTARLDSADRHVADLARLTHDRRALLADEMRRETAAAVVAHAAKEAAAREAIDARLTAHAIALRDDFKREIARLDSAGAKAERRISEAWRAIGDLAAKVAGLESRPTPERVVVERRVEVPVYLYPLIPQRCR